MTYFKDLLAHYKLNTAKVDHGGSAPKTLVRKAKTLLKRESRLGETYDRVYCVFDRDVHDSFEEASNDARKSNLCLARSWPCFEYWLLLHFCITRQPFAKSSSGSSGDACKSELQKHFPDYSKEMQGLFDHLKGYLEKAIQNAATVATEAIETNEPNPSTEVHKLVVFLQSLKSS